jgi:transposase InsO family protein
MIVSDNGTELTSNTVLAWCGEIGVEWHYIAPGKPTRWGRRIKMNQTIEEEEQGACPYGHRHTIQQAGLRLSRALLVAQLYSTQCSYCTWT